MANSRFYLDRYGVHADDVMVPWVTPLSAVIGTYIVTAITEVASGSPPDVFRARMMSAVRLTPMFISGAIFTEYLVRRYAARASAARASAQMLS